MLACTTRSVSPTDAGEQLLKAVAPRFEEIKTGVAGPVKMGGGKPAGIVRISIGEHAVTIGLWPALRRVLPNHPDIRVEVVVSTVLIDIAA